MTDAERERNIEKRYQWLIHANTPEQRREMWKAYRQAINSRSRQQIERMESERGLR